MPGAPTTSSRSITSWIDADAGGVPGVHHVRAVGGVADPEELAGVELDLAAAERLMRRHVLHDGVQHGAVARRLRGEPVGGLQADRAGHVAGDDRGLARDVPADVARQQPRAQVIVAARRGRDQHGQGLAAIEIRHRIGGSRQRQQCERERQRCGRQAARGHDRTRRTGACEQWKTKGIRAAATAPMVAGFTPRRSAGRVETLP